MCPKILIWEKYLANTRNKFENFENVPCKFENVPKNFKNMAKNYENFPKILRTWQIIKCAHKFVKFFNFSKN
jgi:hypothetical protein